MKKLSSNIIENFNHQWKLIRDIALVEKCINEKWLPICKGDKVGNGIKDCALCVEYYKPLYDEVCGGCPIAIESESYICEDTPYTKMAESWCKLNYLNSLNYRAEVKQAAYAELFYLHDLADSLRDQLKELQDELI